MRNTIITMMLCASILALGGCISVFSQQSNYVITGLDEEQDNTKEFLQSILEDRLAKDIDADEDTLEFERYETAREEKIAIDLVTALKARGYYEAEIAYQDDESAPLTGTYIVQSGARYMIASIDVVPEQFEVQFEEQLNSDMLKKGAPLNAIAVLQAQSDLIVNIQKDQCYFSSDVEHSVLLDRKEKTAALTYRVDIGPSATFGPVIFEGQETVKLSHFHKLVPWKEGDCFRLEKIKNLRTALLESGLFVRADGALPDAPDENGRVPVTIQLKERAHKSIKAGVSYYTDEGGGVTLGWEHRNLFGAAEKLQAGLNVSQIKQSFGVGFTKPYFLRKDQSLGVTSTLRQQQTDAFDETAFDAGAGIQRKFGRHITASGGVAFTFSEIKDEDGAQTYGLLSTPTSVTFDNRDDKLDPHKGWQIKADIQPFYDMLGESDPFTKVQFGARTYFDFGTSRDIVLALRANTGALIGASAENIPATELFYAGGGGSVRGFGYQEVGPFEDGDPTGGRSFVTGSTELRMKFTDTLGGVAFVDAGTVSASATPEFNAPAVGAGVGVRYYTGFGPLRFDVAVPLREKDNLKQNYQFYISIGQAF